MAAGLATAVLLGLFGVGAVRVGGSAQDAELSHDPDRPAFLEEAAGSEADYLQRRAEYEALVRGEGPDTPPGARQAAVDQQRAEQAHQAQDVARAIGQGVPSGTVAPATTPWTSIGPTPIPNGQITTNGPVSGRITAVAIDPTNVNIVYIAAAQGGVWRTTNGGTTWTPIFDSATTSAVGALTLAPTDHTKLYVGTGESSNSCDSFDGVGVYRIDNADTTANLVGPINPVVGSTPAFAGRSISRILVSPTDAATIFVATTSGIVGLGCESPLGGTAPPLSIRGIFRSSNATAAAGTVAFARLPVPWTNRSVQDLTFSASDPNIMLAGVFGTTDGGVWRTANALAVDPTTVSFSQTKVVNSIARYSFSAVNPGAVSTIYVGTGENPGGTSGNAGRLFKSSDNGATWSSAITSADGFCGGQCGYDLVVAADPTDANVVYIGGSSNWTAASTPKSSILKKSTDGVNFTDMNAGLHSDTHAIVIAPSPSNQIVYTGDDGGIFKSVNGGSVWTDLNSAPLNTVQFQSVAVHPIDPHFTLGGTQDNGTEYQNSASSWTRADFGDGGFALIDQNATDTTAVLGYHTYFNQTGNLMGVARASSTASYSPSLWTFLGCGGQANGISCGDSAVMFYAPIALGPGSPNNTLYYGSDHLYRSPDQGSTMSSASQVFQSGVAISAIAISPQDDNVRVVGLQNGRLFATTTGSSTMTEIGASLPGKFIGRIAIDPHDTNTVYVGVGGYAGGPSNHIWKTTNLSAATPTWTNVSTGIPDVPVNGLVVDPSDSRRLFAGTDIGAYFSTDAGATWSPLGTGLPVVSIFDIAVAAPRTGGEIVRIATHGRGMWDLPLPASSRFGDDFNDDHAADVGVYRPNTGAWITQDSGTGNTRHTYWGNGTTDVAAPGDYDGDYATDIAVYRSDTGGWFIRNSKDGSLRVDYWGNGTTDIPVPGDYDGDGKTDLAVFRPEIGRWFIKRSSDGVIVQQRWGNLTGGDVPVPGDYDGDGKTDLAVYRPSINAFFVLYSSDASQHQTYWGQSGDLPVPADYDGDGKTDLAVYRPATGAWFIINSSNAAVTSRYFGAAGGDTPAPADYDRDGKADLAVYRKATGGWFISQSSDSTLNSFVYGNGTTDVPVPLPNAIQRTAP